jgi:putative tricarboxylic transport membrane protein
VPTILLSISNVLLQSSGEVDLMAAFMESLQAVFTPMILGLMLAGLLLGIVLGAIPGLGAVLGMTIVLPLTIALDGTGAAVLLISIYSGALYGASIASILVNVPGTAAAAATTFDGYSMTEQGRSLEALEVSATASALGGGLTMLLLFVLIPYLQPIVLAFGAPEIFVLALFGIVMIGVIASQGSFFKGITSGMFGVLIMTIGVAQTKPFPRYTFGIIEFYNGLNFVAILIGMFALGEMLRISDLPGSVVKQGREISGERFEGIRVVFRNKLLTIKSAMLGMVIGAIPGVGAGTSNFFSYAEAIRSSDTPEKFGDAYAPGVIAAEASNNGTVAGSLVPVLAFGIPGSASTAVLLGGFIMHGITPGIELFTVNINLTYTMLLSLVLGNIVILVVGNFVVTSIGSYITQLETDIIIPVILVFSIIGAIGIRSNWIDIATVFVFGWIAFYMKLFDYSVIALVLGAVLSSIIEANFIRSMQRSGGDPIIFAESTISQFLLVFMFVFISVAFFGPQIKKRMPSSPF